MARLKKEIKMIKVSMADHQH